MPIEITFSYRDQATPVVVALDQEVASGRIEEVMGRAGTNRVQEHLFRMNAERPNRLGGRRTNFYASASRSTNYESKPGEVKININQVGIRQRLQGGVIRPVNKKFLTVPAVAEGHGRRASEFNNLRVAYGTGGRPVALVESAASGVSFGRKKKDGSRAVIQGEALGGRVIFWLVKEVNQKPDPSVLPTNDDIKTVCSDAADRHLLTVRQRAEKGAQ